jgi:APA family basic amino acid/polyamine antiporter
LTYYAVANAAAWSLPSAQRRRSRWIPLLGLGGCLLLVLTLPTGSVVGGVGALAVGVAAWFARRRRAVPPPAVGGPPGDASRPA